MTRVHCTRTPPPISPAPGHRFGGMVEDKMAPSNSNPAPSAAISARVAAHYRRKALRTEGVFSSMCGIWADKAAAGHTNAFVRRVERIAARSGATA